MNYTFSIVMAVFNVEEYLDEAISSLVRQDYGFDRVQVILVNDGSTDGSLEKCREWQQRYPDNILVATKENGGQASARNLGMQYAGGRIINFMDPDDRLDPKALRLVAEFFDGAGEKVTAACIPMVYFDARKEEHWQNGKFAQGTRVIDLETEYQVQLTSASSTFFLREDVADLRFNEKLPSSEDFLYVLEALKKRKKLGVVAGTVYGYRARSNGQSTIGSITRNPKWYKEWFEEFADRFPREAEKTGEPVPDWVQYAVGSDLSWRFRSEYRKEMQSILTAEEQEAYYGRLKKSLSWIEDRIITGLKYTPQEYLIQMLRCKHGAEPETAWEEEPGFVLRMAGKEIFQVRDCAAEICFIREEGNRIILEGQVWLCCVPELEKMDIYIRTGEGISVCRSHMIKARLVRRQNWNINQPKAFRAELNLEAGGEIHDIRVGLGPDPEHITWIRQLTRGPYLPLSLYPRGSGTAGKWKYTLCPEFVRFIRCDTFVKKLKRELGWEKTLLQVRARKALLYRWAGMLLRRMKRKQIWMISDRVCKAGDSGEVFYRYLLKNHSDRISAYFVLDAASRDYPRMKETGRTVPYFSWKHKLLTLGADVVISSSGRGNMALPFDGQDEWQIDTLGKIPFVFLQHGIIKDDLSKWLNRWNENLQGFVTSVRPEYESIVHGDYEYTEKEIWMTGLPRFDELRDEKEKIIVVMPTWRKNLMDMYHHETGTWSVKPEFRESEYCTFYRRLLNHPEMKRLREEKGYRIWFVPHPNIEPHTDLFDLPEWVEKVGTELGYSEIFARGSLVITDFSSVAFDFVYLGKPVIYSQFDEESFFDGAQIYDRGYFDYRRDGFGPVTGTLEETLAEIRKIVERDCTMEEKYRERLDRFFTYRDRGNCDRVYRKITGLLEEKGTDSHDRG